MPSNPGHETGIIIARESNGKKVPKFQLVPPMERKESRTSDSGISMCQYCNSSSNNTSASPYTALLGPSYMASAPILANYDRQHYLNPEYSNRSKSSSRHHYDINNNNNNNYYNQSPSPTPSHSSHQAVTAYCYCSRCTGRQTGQRTKMYSKFKTASNAARAVARFESSLTAKETEAMFDHQPRDEFHKKTEHGCFRKSVPSMPLFVAIPCCLFNFFLPGLGTLIATASLLFGCTTEYGDEHRVKAFLLGLLITFVQVTTAIFVLGWVWSIMWGINFVKHSSTAYDGSLSTYPEKRQKNREERRLRSSRHGSASSHTQMLESSIGADRGIVRENRIRGDW